MHNDRYVIGYAATLCVVASLLLAVASAALRGRQERMVELDRQFNVLKAFGAPVADAAGRRSVPNDEVARLYRERVREMFLDGATGEPRTNAAPSAAELERKTVLPLYLWLEDGAPAKYAFPTSGKGLWSTIYGYLALDRTLSEVVGITFYRHGETPGLGGEVERSWFQQQFAGQRIHGPNGLLRLEVAKGRVADRYPNGNPQAVDGISGATMTGNGLNGFLNEDLERYERYFSRIRKG